MDSNEARIAQLEAEAQQHAVKFDEWKAKAKASVEKHREQIIALSSELEDCRRTKTRFDATAASHVVWGAQSLSLALDTAALKAELNTAARAQAAEAEAAALRTQLMESAAQFDKYKKRAEQTLRLSSKDHQGIAEESTKLKEAIEVALGQLTEAREGVNQRNIAISVLEKQLDALNVLVDSLHGQLERAQQGASRDGAKALSEEDVDRVRQEFGEREAIIFEQHRDEILRLSSAHEAEMEQVRLEEAGRLAAALAEAQQRGASSSTQRDRAYDALLAEHDETRAALAAVARDNAALREQLGKLLPRGDGSAVPATNATPAQLQKRVHELEAHVMHLSDQLWTANHSALEAKAAHDAPHQQQARAKPDAQQQSYFRSVLVKLLCAHTDDIKSSLMPVLTTIAQLDANDLRQIYGANPGWIN